MHSPTEGFSKPPADASASVESAGSSSSLTYEPFYRLREKPFSLSADPRFLFRSAAHRPAFDQILVGIRRREGLIVLTGEIGTGKTTLCRSVLEHLDRRTFAAFVADPFVSREDLLKTLLVDFGVISIGDLTSGRFSGVSRSDLSYLLYEFLDSLVPLQAFAVLIIDEAQNLSLPLLEEIRILSELERREKLLQVVLVGQPELRANLKLPQMRQVDQRVSVRCELKPLDVGGVVGYVNHRLLVAGGGERAVEFTRGALEAVHHGSSGVPRLINLICDRALQRAHLSRSRQIDTEFVAAALDDLGLDVPTPTEEPLRVEKPSSTDRPSVSAAVQPPVPPAAADAASSAPSLIAFASELDFGDAPGAADRDQSLFADSDDRPGSRRRWMPWAASILAASVAIGALARYERTPSADAQIVALPLPLQARPAAAAVALAPKVDESLPLAPAAGTGARGSYTILVASFKSAERAGHVVEELTNAGLGAHAVERDGGPGRGRLLLVMVSGYTSATDVQRDLQQIRALPGGYTDARVVDQQ